MNDRPVKYDRRSVGLVGAFLAPWDRLCKVEPKDNGETRRISLALNRRIVVAPACAAFPLYSWSRTDHRLQGFKEGRVKEKTWFLKALYVPLPASCKGCLQAQWYLAKCLGWITMIDLLYSTRVSSPQVTRGQQSAFMVTFDHTHDLEIFIASLPSWLSNVLYTCSGRTWLPISILMTRFIIRCANSRIMWRFCQACHNASRKIHCLANTSLVVVCRNTTQCQVKGKKLSFTALSCHSLFMNTHSQPLIKTGLCKLHHKGGTLWHCTVTSSKDQGMADSKRAGDNQLSGSCTSLT